MENYAPTKELTISEEEIRNWLERYVANNIAGGLKNFGKFWSDDVTWFPPDSPAIHGKQAIIDFVKAAFDNYNLEQKLSITEIKIACDIAYLCIEGHELFTPKKENLETLEINNKGVFLFRKESDGTLLATHVIWNFNKPSKYFK